MRRIQIVFDTIRTEAEGSRQGPAKTNGALLVIWGMILNDAEKKWGADQTILLAYNQAEARTFVERCLVRWGYVVLAAKDGTEALEMFEKHRETIDLIVLDSQMPGLDEVMCAKAIFEQSPRTPILLMTGSAYPDVYRRAAGTGVKAVIEKPVSVGDLEAIVARMLDEEDKSDPVRVP